MSNEALLRILGYVWTFFGAYWMSSSVLARNPDDNSRILKFAVLAATFVALFLGRNVVPPALILVFAIAWTALGLYWGAPDKAAQSGEFKWYRLLRLMILAGVFALLFWKATAIGILGMRLLPQFLNLGLLGFAAAIAGLCISAWARITLGRYWSDKVILQTEHQLIRTGPYSRMRHPLYSGVLLAVLGTAVIVGEVRGFLSFAVLLVNYVIKARREERILANRFGNEFSGHLQSTGFLLPRLRRS